jgi:uncharacterized membrane protein
MAGKIVALAFDGEQTADGMLDNFLDMEQRQVISLEDAVVVSRGAGTTEVKVDQTHFKRGRAATTAGAVGLLAGMLVGGPLVGLTVGALWGGMRDKGISDKFIRQLTARLQPDSSALFLLVSSADGEKVLEELTPHQATIITTDLDPAVEKKLRETLA